MRISLVCDSVTEVQMRAGLSKFAQTRNEWEATYGEPTVKLDGPSHFGVTFPPMEATRASLIAEAMEGLPEWERELLRG